ncbi:hypothetical protein SRHO_G00038710 [Serrasalmus rhombeus]
MSRHEPVQTKQRCEAETAKTITDEMWGEAWTEAHQTTNSNMWREVIPKDPTVALLGIIPADHKARKRKISAQALTVKPGQLCFTHQKHREVQEEYVGLQK